MPKHTWVTPEEFERLTGSRGSVYIGPAPVRRPKRQEVFLCPHCREICTGSRPGILRCEPCRKEWLS
jgi:hypothetical protein